MKFRNVWILAVAFLGCGDDVAGDAGTDGNSGDDVAQDVACAPAALPTDGSPYSLTAAGAPAALFGSASAPTFREGYATLLEIGFTRFFPFFSTREIIDPPEGDMTGPASSGHEAFFFAPSCADGVGFSAATEAGMEILFPGFFFSPEGEFEDFDDAAFRTSFETYQSNCFKENEGVITGFYTYDEMAGNWAGAELLNRGLGASNPLPRIENATALATALRSVSDVDIYAVDAPTIPLLERDRAAIVGAGVDLDMLLADYQEQLETFAASADSFGFDVYPIPESYWFPIQESGNLVRVAREVAPANARVSAVLQGMSYDAQGGHTGVGASGPPPTLEQTRFMAFDAIVAGAEELMWYGPNFLDLDRAEDDAFWGDLGVVVGEVQAVGRALNGTRRSIDVGNADVSVAAFEVQNGELIVVVHRADSETTATLPLPDGTRLIRHPTGEIEPNLSVTLGPLDVQLFLTTTCATGA